MNKKSLINFIASMSYQVSGLLIGLIIPKYYTEIFGSMYNGLNQSVSQIISLLSVLQFGISAVSIQQMFQYITSRDEKMISAIYWYTDRQYRKMGYAFIALIVPIAFLFPFIIHDNVSYMIVVAFVCIRALSASMEYFFQAKYSVILIAHNKSYAVYIVNTILLFITTGFQLCVLFFIKDIIMYQSIAIIITLLRLFIVSVYVKKKFPFITDRTAPYSPPKDKRRKDVLISEIAGMVTESTDLLVLSAFSGLVNASIYSVYNFVTTGLGSILSSCREAVFAGIGQTYFVSFKCFQDKMNRFEKVYFSLAFYLYSVAIIVFRPFIEIYTANMDAVYYYSGFPILFLLARLVINLRIPCLVAINTAGHFKQVRNYAVVEAGINLTISLLLVRCFGIYGVLIGTIAGALYRTPMIINYTCKHILKQSVFVYIKKILIWIPVFLSCYIFSCFVNLSASSLTQWVFITAFVLAFVAVLFIIWMALFDRESLIFIKNIAFSNKERRK